MKVNIYEGKEPYIFISYAHKDMDKVIPIVERLVKDGYRVWYDEGIAPIETWDDFIAGKVEECEIMLAFISNNYINSSNCMDELNYARDCDKKILRVHVEKNVDLPRGVKMRLNRIQAVFRTDYDNEDNFFEKLYLAKDISMCLKTKNNGEISNIQIIKYNDSVYEGELFNGKRHGKGIMTYANGNVYDGEWEANKRHGKGKMIYENGDIYDGEWKNHKKNGQGKMIYANGDVYEGEWKDDKRDGKGKTTEGGEIYEGEWKEDEKSGKGKCNWYNGDVYEGEWKNDIQNGYGKMTYFDGNVYENEFDILFSIDPLYTNVNTYEGEWKNGMLCGHGKLTFADGKELEGEWENGKFKG